MLCDDVSTFSFIALTPPSSSEGGPPASQIDDKSAASSPHTIVKYFCHKTRRCLLFSATFSLNDRVIDLASCMETTFDDGFVFFTPLWEDGLVTTGVGSIVGDTESIPAVICCQSVGEAARYVPPLQTGKRGRRHKHNACSLPCVCRRLSRWVIVSILVCGGDDDRVLVGHCPYIIPYSSNSSLSDVFAYMREMRWITGAEHTYMSSLPTCYLHENFWETEARGQGTEFEESINSDKSGADAPTPQWVEVAVLFPALVPGTIVTASRYRLDGAGSLDVCQGTVVRRSAEGGVCLYDILLQDCSEEWKGIPCVHVVEL